MERRPIPDEVRWEEEPIAEPAAAGAPPRKPPTAVGQDDPGDDPEDGPGWPWHDAFTLDMPLEESRLTSSIVRRLRAHGHRTVGDVLDLTDAHLRRDGVGLIDRSRFRLWRLGWLIARRDP